MHGSVVVEAGVGLLNSEDWSQGSGWTFTWRGGTAQMGGGGGGGKGIVPSTPTLGWQEGLWMAWLIWSKWWVVEREGGGVVGH